MEHVQAFHEIRRMRRCTVPLYIYIEKSLPVGWLAPARQLGHVPVDC